MNFRSLPQSWKGLSSIRRWSEIPKPAPREIMAINSAKDSAIEVKHVF